MATIVSPAPPLNDDEIPTVTLAVPAMATASRRLPPPCWTAEETAALIDAYRDKWYSLRRGNLRANHWQEVADAVASRCTAVSPLKTSVQCRHKMEKLRKRYRGEIQRAAAHGGVRRYSSPWTHFRSMHAMEKGSNQSPPSSSSSEHEDPTATATAAAAVKRINNLYNYNHQRGVLDPNRGGTPGFRIKIPAAARVYPKLEEEIGQNQNPNPNPKFPKSEMRKRKLVGAIEALGEGLMRMEKVKMEMVQKIEEMRMENELKRTEMILAAQQRIVAAFADAAALKIKDDLP
ncbi:trihelix transcription factor ENAP1-like [Andrographis paniculata]|uniref:trihelix transcription factor ENAP1-like n=1 Tax=Andrographis paniculata TaxID=175694 RepID=UPI0021E914AE|nr:trihelix transcription factor ENAP1-like [Andrographis paniculata]